MNNFMSFLKVMISHNKQFLDESVLHKKNKQGECVNYEIILLVNIQNIYFNIIKLIKNICVFILILVYIKIYIDKKILIYTCHRLFIIFLKKRFAISACIFLSLLVPHTKYIYIIYSSSLVNVVLVYVVATFSSFTLLAFAPSISFKLNFAEPLAFACGCDGSGAQPIIYII
jgi:hypothetical protein